ncbi:AfsR/SARP family transcriptional regulator [Streptomyces olivoreticuli]|uniref:OmpR/PhoB-type domain-containing protein n=1 Tax=Streptomyces blastmyceticus TaxID=68180 RepID=A0ABN0Y1Q2_9ACTN|nr:AfsR/SARP family transcriptional regulator [Streptomyces olivoreticuli]WKK22665.1 AfsR/SARP family transcriptional regulator [Streptomyces olivoreticuli]
MDGDGCFCVLGPLRVTADGQTVSIPAGKQRALLATLLVNANEVVPVGELVDRLWCEDLPDRPRRALHTLLTRLRRSLDGTGAGLGRHIRTTPGGYTIEIAPHHLDHMRFAELTRRAQAAADRGDTGAEAGLLTEALALWHGEPLADIESDCVRRDATPQLLEGWFKASERYHDVCLSLGRHHEIVGELRTLTVKYPFQEHRWSQLMIALHRCGRTGEALEAYAAVSHAFRDQLGVEPGERLRRLHVALLRDEAEPVPRGPMERYGHQAC